MKKRKDHRGSEWRKWDLHIHAPGTKLNDQFKTDDGGDVWDEYCQKLYASDVQAFGIADYFSVDCYETVCKEYQRRYPDSRKLFFPNIELRASYAVNQAQEIVHLHLLFNSFISDHKEKIKRFLSILKTNKTNDSGLNIKASELRDKSCYESATTTREFIQEALVETYGKNSELLNYVFIITAANSNGIRAKLGNPRSQLISMELDKFSDAFFGNAGNVDWFLKTDRAGDKREDTKPKPVLSCCDAHSLSDIDEKLGQVCTWIKADLTWEGLKQIIFEPKNRVFIGEEPKIERRVRENNTRYIESLHITCVDEYKQQHGSWFNNEKIVFGKELVAIIGNKGSGKSAVTDIIGLLGNSRNQTCKCQSNQKSEELFSFLNEKKFCKGGLAKHFQGTLNWHGGEPDCKGLNEKVAAHLPEKVEYLPQKYLERVCTNIEDNEFRETLNEVVFRYVEKQDRYGKTNLDDLIEYLSQQAELDIERKKNELHQANITVVLFEKKLTEDYRNEIEGKIRLKKDELKAHEKIKPDEKPNPTAAAPQTGTSETTEIDALRKKINEFETEITQLESEQISVNQIVNCLQQVKQSIKRATDALSDLEGIHEDVLANTGLDFNQIVKLTVEYSALDEIVARNTLRLKQIDKLLTTEDDQTATEEAKAESLICQKAKFEAQKAEAVERLGKDEREYQQYLTELKKWRERNRELLGEEQNPEAETQRGLEQELDDIDNLYQKRLCEARHERERISKELFSKKRELTWFYNTVKQSIDNEIAKCRKDLGEYNISIEAGLRFNIESFLEEFLKFINQKAAGSYHGKEDGRDMLQQFFDTVENWEDEEQVFSALNDIVEALHTDRRGEISSKQTVRNVFKQIKGQQTPQELYDYIFGFDYLEPKYDLKVDSKDLSELSPGERGGLLLIFYLMLDRQDIPLVIDQPEDNLDNKSVYQILVTFIKEAKKCRQIILVTHNPNLAVVADAEQIIHVSIDKKDGKHDFDFFSGSIEETSINRTVVDILEGTLPAFDNRRLKYRKIKR